MKVIENASIPGEYRIFGITVRPMPITAAGWASVIGLYKLAIITLMIVMLTGCYDDEKTAPERVENAADEVSQGFEDAADELDPNRTAGEEVGDAVEDAGQAIEDAAQK